MGLATIMMLKEICMRKDCGFWKLLREITNLSQNRGKIYIRILSFWLCGVSLSDYSLLERVNQDGYTRTGQRDYDFNLMIRNYKPSLEENDSSRGSKKKKIWSLSPQPSTRRTLTHRNYPNLHRVLKKKARSILSSVMPRVEAIPWVSKAAALAKS